MKVQNPAPVLPTAPAQIPSQPDAAHSHAARRPTPASALGTVLPQRSPRPPDKTTPYIPTRLPKGNFNFRPLARVQGSEQLAQVKCRHFAEEVATNPGPWRATLGLLALKEGGTDAERWPGVSLLLDDKIDMPNERLNLLYATAPASSKHLVDSGRFGHYMADLAQALPPAAGDRTRTVRCLLTTMTHVMALEVAGKTDANGHDYYAAKLYDPNMTAAYKRVEASSPQELARWSLQDMLPHAEAFTVYGGAPGKPLVMAALCLDPDMAPAIDRMQSPPTRDRLILAVDMSMDQDLHSMMDVLASSGTETQLRNYDLLSLEERPGRPMMHFAYELGRPDTLRTLVQGALRTPLPEDQLEDILTAPMGDRSVLNRCLAQGTTDMLIAVIEPILSSDLSPRTKVALLGAGDLDQGSLFDDVTDGQSATVSAYLECILGSSLGADDKAALVEASNSKGESALQVVTEKGYASLASVMVTRIRGSDLPEDAKCQLLKVPPDKLPRMIRQMTNGDASAMALLTALASTAAGLQAGLKAIEESDSNSTTKFRWMHALAATALGEAVTAGDTSTVTALISTLAASGLSAPEQAALMRGTSPDAESALLKAIRLGQPPSAKAFTAAVLASGLPHALQVEVLKLPITRRHPPSPQPGRQAADVDRAIQACQEAVNEAALDPRRKPALKSALQPADSPWTAAFSRLPFAKRR